jgi:hypothetical protein
VRRKIGRAARGEAAISGCGEIHYPTLAGIRTVRSPPSRISTALMMLFSSASHRHFPTPPGTAGQMPPLRRHMSAIFTRVILGAVRPTLTDNTARWAFIGAVSLISATGLWVLGVEVAWGSLWPLFERPALFLVFAVAYSMIGRRVSRVALPMGVVSDFLLSGLQVTAMMLAILPLSYLAAAVDFPLARYRIGEA